MTLYVCKSSLYLVGYGMRKMTDACGMDFVTLYSSQGQNSVDMVYPGCMQVHTLTRL